ncbi:MAG: putative ABC transporter ATP-binding protein YxlF [candidate division BRC1 bacterium ADurb.BinA292]|nr:MAG: putative ABC transporter ATP-binding protein YxlF [candidate division BRC1 bacterium ADurb.BinA292]
MSLRIEQLRKVYSDGKVALHGLDLELAPGVFGLLGPNGAGKSTLLEILSLNLMPTSGRVLWDGRDIHRQPNAYRRILGYLPQSYGFYPELTVRAFLHYMGGLYGLGGRRLRRRIAECLELVGLSAELRKKTKALSGGMRQRLAIAHALLHEPKLLIVDEPTTGLDPAERVAFRNLLFDLGRSATVILSTHIVKDVEFTCHRMMLLYDGRARFLGPPADFIERVRGRVLLTEIPAREFESFSRAHDVVAIQERGDRMEVRFLNGAPATDQGSPPGVRPAAPNLEDAYVDFIRERRDEQETRVGSDA